VILKKDYDLVVVGKSYLHYIYALEALKENSNVLLLEDSRLSFGDLYSHGIGDLEYSYLVTLGNDRDIAPLRDLSCYLSEKVINFHWEGIHLILGGEPWDNLKELSRKYPSFFPFNDFICENDSFNFNLEFKTYVKLLGKSSYRFKMIQNVNMEYFLKTCPVMIKKLYESFKDCLDKDEENSKPFLYFFRGYYHKFYSSAHPDYEIFHLFILLLSKHYVINQDKLMSDLTPVLIGFGGDYKETKIQDWKFHKSRPWSLELSSFEGIIHPEKIVFLGCDPRKLSLRASCKEALYQSVHFRCPIEDSRLSFFKDSIIVQGNRENMGGSIPSWQFEIEDGDLVGFCAFRKNKGSKVSFVEEELKRWLEAELNKCLPRLSSSLIDDIDFNLGEEFFPDDSFHYKKAFIPKQKSIVLSNYSNPLSKEKLSNVSYIGPLKRHAFGFYGQLLTLKEGSYFH
jgi:hypothetical protein